MSAIEILRQLAEYEGRGTQVFRALRSTITFHVGPGTDPVVEPETHCSLAIQPEGKLQRLAGVYLYRVSTTPNIRAV